MKKTTISIFVIVFFLFITSCSKKNDGFNSTCDNKTEFHFSGFVNNNLKCFNQDVQNYQLYIGASGISDEAPLGRYMIGMNTWPVTVGDENIFLSTPVIDLEDPSKVPPIFPLRELTLNERSKFQLEYGYITSVENIPYEREIHTANFDNNSSIEIISFEEIDSNTNSIFKVSLLISCKLYDKSGNLKGEIKHGELTGLIYVYDSQ